MATTTYEPLISYTVPSNTTTVTLGSGGQGTISSTYTDLVLVINGIINYNIFYRFNGDTASNYSETVVYGNGSSPGSARESNATGIYIGDYIANPMSTTNSTAIIQVMNYANTTTYKTSIFRLAGTSAGTQLGVGLWRKTPEAINAISLNTDQANGILAGTTFNLYGIANAAIGAPKATGGIITYDDTYYYHTFGASGTFTPQQSLTADILVVAGGGGGGRRHGGGGGAGGLLYQTGRSLSATGYSITVGAGGAGNSTGYPNGNGASGANTTFDTITANGGGGGGGANISPSNGGSGGGSQASWATTATATQGNSGGATGYGFNGGAGYSASGINHGAGGGGAGAIGGDADASNSGNGGAGRQYLEFSNATGTGVVGYYAGGGGGATFDTGNSGSGGAGGGGAGNKVGSGVNGVANTGSGGGAQGDDNGGQGGNGGSGVVIIRYLKA